MKVYVVANRLIVLVMSDGNKRIAQAKVQHIPNKEIRVNQSGSLQ